MEGFGQPKDLARLPYTYQPPNANARPGLPQPRHIGPSSWISSCLQLEPSPRPTWAYSTSAGWCEARAALWRSRIVGLTSNG